MPPATGAHLPSPHLSFSPSLVFLFSSVRTRASRLTNFCLPLFSFSPFTQDQRTFQPRPRGRMLVFLIFPVLHYFWPISCFTSLSPSCLPSRRSLVFKFFIFSCRLASSRISAFGFQCLFACIGLNLACMYRFRGCVGNLIVLLTIA